MAGCVHQACSDRIACASLTINVWRPCVARIPASMGSGLSAQSIRLLVQRKVRYYKGVPLVESVYAGSAPSQVRVGYRSASRDAGFAGS